MSDDPLEQLIDDWLTLDSAGALLGVPPSKVKNMGRDLELVVLRTHGSKEWRVPALFFDTDAPVKGLAGTIHLLHDAGYDERETLAWLFTADDTLPGRPIDALRADRGKEVRRRAQAAL